MRPRVPPKAVPRQARPVTSRKGRAWISSPAPATPMTIDCPQPLCAQASACPITSTLPMHSKEKSTPPRVISTTASARPGTVAGSRTSVAPSRRAMANFSGLVSMPMMRPAPAMTAPWMTDSPMPPSPKTATVAPGWTFAVFSTAPMPVVTPQPRRQTLSSGASGRILASAISGTTV